MTRPDSRSPGRSDTRGPAHYVAAAGLSTSEARARLLRDGPNEIEQRRRGATARAVIGSLGEPMLLLLAAVAALYAMVGSWRDATAMAISVAFVIALNLYQNVRSERALDALRALAAPRARVMRDGASSAVPATDIVQGDVLVIAEGDRIAADARLLGDAVVEVDESLLTGESVPVTRAAADDSGQLHAGTFVVQGEGFAEVLATGVRTELGRVGSALATVSRAPSPLRRQVRGLVRLFAVLSASGAIVLTLTMLMRGMGLREAALAALTFAIATVPEEFPVVLSVLFALGAWRLARIRALIQRPDAIETLGCLSVLCTDKTGTLTENRMRVEAVQVADDAFAHRDAHEVARADVLAVAASACPAQPVDAMDIAILEAAGPRAKPPGVHRFYPFSTRLRATGAAVETHDGTLSLRCKGSSETVATLCGLDGEQRAAVDRDVASMAARGLRVIAVARADGLDPARVPDALDAVRMQWCGLLALADPLRADVPAALRSAREAGIRVLLVTGDHPATAVAIARAAGIANTGDVLTGAEIEAMSQDALTARARQCDVYARVRPADKLKLVRSLIASGEVVGMTGDGVNDAPALAAAHVGIAMGQRGSDVARHAATVVLADDRFASIVEAIRMGRSIHANLMRALQYIVAVHVPIAGAALMPVLAGMPPILLPIHIVLLELVIDPASTLVFERRPEPRDAMRVPPRPLGAPLLSRRALASALGLGGVALLGTVAAYALAGGQVGAGTALSAYVFVSILAGNIALLAVTAWDGRAGYGSLRDVMVAALLAGVLLLIATGTPAIARVLHLEGVGTGLALAACSAPAVLVVLAEGLRRAVRAMDARRVVHRA